MRGRGTAGRGLIARGPFIPAILQDVGYGFVAQEIVAQGQRASALHALLAVVFYKTRDSQDRAIRLLRVSPV